MIFKITEDKPLGAITCTTEYLEILKSKGGLLAYILQVMQIS